jgi:hypothetical protein
VQGGLLKCPRASPHTSRLRALTNCTGRGPPRAPEPGAKDGSAVHVMLALRRCSRPIVVTDEELNGTDMVGELLGKGQRVADQP